MCGIVGALVFGTPVADEEMIKREAIIFIGTQLLQATVERGKDATGMSALFADGNYIGLKMGIPAPEFIARYGDKESEFRGFIKILREYKSPLSVVLGHCRKATVGNTYENKNNQPIQVGDIVIIHNGTIENHEKIFKEIGCEREADVDSEIIAQLLHKYSNKGKEPFTLEMLEKVVKHLDGSFSVLGFNGNNPYQVVQLRAGRPAEMVLVKPLKTVFIASEKKFLENVLFEYNKFARLFSRTDVLPCLQKEDIEFSSLADDYIGVWDLTKEITSKTKTTDLFNGEEIPDAASRAAKRTRAYTYAPYYYGNYSSGYVNSYDGFSSNKPETRTYLQPVSQAPTIKSQSKESVRVSAYLWSSTLNKFVKESVTIVPSGAVEINSEDGKIVSSGQSSYLIEAPVGKNDSPAPAQVEVKEHGPDTEDDNSRKEEKAETAAKEPETEGEDTKVMDVEIDTDALTKANLYVESSIVKFTSDEDLFNELGIKDENGLRNLPLFAFANRVLKSLAWKHFYDGYTARKKEEQVESKTKSLKEIVKVLQETLEGFGEKKVEKRLRKVLEGSKNEIIISQEQFAHLTKKSGSANPVTKYLRKKLRKALKE